MCLSLTVESFCDTCPCWVSNSVHSGFHLEQSHVIGILLSYWKLLTSQKLDAKSLSRGVASMSISGNDSHERSSTSWQTVKNWLKCMGYVMAHRQLHPSKCKWIWPLITNWGDWWKIRLKFRVFSISDKKWTLPSKWTLRIRHVPNNILLKWQENETVTC